jgi:hypothetical protein
VNRPVWLQPSVRDARPDQPPLLSDAGSEGGTTDRTAAPLVLGAFVACCVLLISFFSPRKPGMEEVGVFNAAYTYAHQGRMSFPIYGINYFDAFGIHPHLHYAILGLLIRLGLTLYSAEAVIISAITLVAIVLIWRGSFPDTVKLGFCLGLYATVVLSVIYLPDDAIGVRPELHLTIAWFAGLVALESARLSNWHLPKLCLGVALVTYAAALQNYALLAPAGLIVYAIWMSRSLPLREAARKMAVCFGAGCLVGIPYLLLYVHPNWEMLRANMNWGATHAPPLSAKLNAYLSVYQGLKPLLWRNLFTTLFAGMPVLISLSARIPLFIAGVALLAIRPSTRGMALASLPVPFLAAWVRPEAQYFISEQMLFLGGFWAVVLGTCELLFRKTTRVQSRPLMLGLSGICCAAMLLGSPPLGEIRSLRRSPLHEMDVARAAAKQIVGPNALVASRHLAWYMSGGSSWYRLENDITEPPILAHFNANLYASQFDALADYSLYSGETQNGTTPSSMYAAGSLQLKGFYLAQRMSGLSLLFFQASKGPAIVGYYLQNDRLQRFDQDASGNWLFLTLVGDVKYPPGIDGAISYPNILSLPGSPTTTAVSALLLPRGAYSGSERSLAAKFRILDMIPGRLSTVDAYALARKSRASDQTIRFVRTPQEDSLVQFLSRGDHPLQRSDSCTATGLSSAQPESPISSGNYMHGFEANNLFDGSASPWASETFGPRTRFISYVGGDFGAGAPVSVRAVRIQQSPDPGSSIDTAVLMASDNNYKWYPIMEVALRKDGAPHVYCVPPAEPHRFWKLLATDNPKTNYAWQISTLRFYR